VGRYLATEHEHVDSNAMCVNDNSSLWQFGWGERVLFLTGGCTCHSTQPTKISLKRPTAQPTSPSHSTYISLKWSHHSITLACTRALPSPYPSQRRSRAALCARALQSTPAPGSGSSHHRAPVVACHISGPGIDLCACIRRLAVVLHPSSICCSHCSTSEQLLRQRAPPSRALLLLSRLAVC
jgi:hypothetical protein